MPFWNQPAKDTTHQGIHSAKPTIIMLIGSMEVGGAELQLIELSKQLAPHFEIRIASITGPGPLASRIPSTMKELASGKNKYKTKTTKLLYLSKLSLKIYLAKPKLIMTWLPHANIYGSILANFLTFIHITTRRSSTRCIQQKRILHALDKFAIAHSNGCLCNSNHAREVVKDLLPENKIYVVKNIVNDAYLKGPNHTKEITHNFKIIMVGNLFAYKNHQFLLRAIPDYLVDRIQVTIIGRDSGQKEYLTAISKKKRLTVNFVETDSPEEILKFMLDHHILVHPSIEEGSPNVIYEARSIRMPVIASDIPGNIEALSNYDKSTTFRLDAMSDLTMTIEYVAENLAIPPSRQKPTKVEYISIVSAIRKIFNESRK